MVVGDPKQQDRKTNEVDSVTILWGRLAKAGLAWPRARSTMANEIGGG